MRLLKFLQEAIDIDNIKLTRTQCPFERGVCFEYEVDDIAFIGEYVYEERNKSITFGFRRAKGTRLMYSQNPDFNKYAGKVYAGMLKGLKEALKEFPETEILVGITVKDPDEKKLAPRINPVTNAPRKTLSNWYNSNFFKSAVEKAAPKFRFAEHKKLSADSELWTYKKTV